VSTFFQPLITPDGREITIQPSPEGGPCGEGWSSSGH